LKWNGWPDNTGSLAARTNPWPFMKKPLAAGALTTVQGLEALGDLRFDAGQYKGALSAYEQAAKAGDSAKLALKLARAADKSGNKSLARSAYARFLSTNPDNPELLLEMARFAINTGNYAQALSLYDRVVAAKGSKGLLLELALANLAAQRFRHGRKMGTASGASRRRRPQGLFGPCPGPASGRQDRRSG